MFGWFKRKPTPSQKPPAPPAEPRAGDIRVHLTDGQREWTESFNFLDSLIDALAKHCHTVTAQGDELLHAESGYAIVPELHNVEWTENATRTLTTITLKHPTLFKEKVFEFQHSWSTSAEHSISEGFAQWAQTDFVALLDAAKPKPDKCMVMLMDFPATDTTPARKRRVIFGPVAHLQSEPPKDKPTHADGDHDFCPCCLFTKSMTAFTPLIEGDGFCALRLFASRSGDGSAAADCRVNGEDFVEGTAGLKQYAAGWPPAGTEFRKQYVILQTLPASEWRS